MRVDVVHTPGHTPEHVSFLITDTAAANDPIAVVSGDFIFVGDVGRPDLLEKAANIKGTMEIGARTLYASLRKLDLAVTDVIVVQAPPEGVAWHGVRDRLTRAAHDSAGVLGQLLG